MTTIRSSSQASLQEGMAGVAFPVAKADLLAQLRAAGVSPARIAAVAATPLDRFASAQEVVVAIVAD